MCSLFLKRSVYNNVVECDNFCYIHFPLIYKTQNQLCLNQYADAAVYFLKMLGIKNKIYNKLIDYLVLEILYSDIEKIHFVAINKFQNEHFYKRIKQLVSAIYKLFPKYCLQFEECIKQRKKADYKEFSKLYKMLVILLAVNNLDCIIETFLPEKIKEDENSSSFLNLISKDIFSHIKYFNNLKNEMESRERDKIVDFYWNASFLESKTGDASFYELSGAFLEKYNNGYSINDLIPDEFSFPEICLNDYDIPLMYRWVNLLQTNTEFRHYWQFRFLRNLRYYFKYNDVVLTQWTRVDYENYFRKIK